MLKLIEQFAGSGTAQTLRAIAPTRSRLIHFVTVMGPGLIVMEADNDAGAVATYTQAGALHGTRLLWVLLILLPVTYIVQEMVARLGIATGKGPTRLFEERFGRRWSVISTSALLVVNFLTLITEFAAIALASREIGLSPVAVVPLAAVGLVALVISGGYRRWERIAIVLCLLDLAWFAMAKCGFPGLALVAHDSLVPSGPISGSMLYLIIAIVGTTIAPWQLYFQQSCVADKGLTHHDLKFARGDTLFGATFTILVAGAMMLVGGAALHQGIKFEDPAQMASALGTHFGPGLRVAILVMMMNAAILGTTAISLSSAWAFGELRGGPSSLHLRVNEAPQFYGVYILGTLAAASLVLIPKMPLQTITIGVQVVAGMFLPFLLVGFLRLVNDRELLAPEFLNRKSQTRWSILIVGVLIALSLVLVVQGLLGA